MKKMNKHITLAALVIAALGLSGTAQAMDYYWDTDGATPGFGDTNVGTWGTDAFWSLSATGESAVGIASITSSDRAIFHRTDAVPAITVNVSGDVTAGNILQWASGDTRGTTLNNAGGGIIHLYAVGSSTPAYQGNGGNSTITINAPIVLEQADDSDVYIGTGGGNQGWTTIAGGVTSTNSVRLYFGRMHNTTISGGSLDIKGSINGVQIYNNLQRGITISANIGSNVTNVSQSSETTRIMTLSGTNSYTGKATVNSGILVPTLPAALPGYDSPDRVVFNGGMLALRIGDWTTAQVDTLLSNATKNSGTLGIDTGAGDLTQWTAFTTINLGSVGLTKRGNNVLTLDQANNYTGVTAVDGGVLRADEGTGLPTASPLIINSGVFETSIDIVRPAGNGTGMMALESNLQNTSVGFSARGGPVKVCFGTLAAPTALTWTEKLEAAYNGPFDMGNTGALILNAATADNTLEFLNPFSLVNKARTVQVDASIATISGIISSTTTDGGLTKAGNGTLVLSATNTYSGPTTINGGALRAAQGIGLPNTYLKLNGGVYETSGAFTRVNSITAAGTNFNWTGNNGGGFSAYGGKLTVTIGNDAATEQVWAAASANNGIRGTLKFGSATANAETEFRNNIDLGDGTRTIDVAAGAGGDFATISGVIRNSAGTGSLTKTGAGRLVLTGANTYTGATTVSGGTLALTGAYTNNIASSPTIRVDDGALLNVTGLSGGTITLAAQRLQGAGTVTGSVIAPSGAVVAPSPVVGGLDIVGDVQMNAGSTYEWALDANTGAALVDITGALTLDTGWKLKLVGSGTPTAKEKYDLFTYTGSFSGDIAGIIDDTGVTGWPTPSIIGQDTGRIYVVFGVLPGDTNEDGVVDAVDYIAIKTNFGLSGTGITRLQGDLIDNDIVDWADLQELMDQFGTRSVGGAPAAPEPGSVMLLMFGAAALLRRRAIIGKTSR